VYFRFHGWSANWSSSGDRLKNSSDGLSAIAQSLGYESESAFGKAFRRTMGCSPRKYSRSATPRAAPATRSVERITSRNLSSPGKLRIYPAQIAMFGDMPTFEDQSAVDERFSDLAPMQNHQFSS
jgi:hypothetical protein